MSIVRAASVVMLLSATAQAAAAESISSAQNSGVPAWVWVCAVIAGIVFATLIHSVITFKPSMAAGAAIKVPRNAAGELIWAIVPIAIVIAAAAPAMTNVTAVTSASDQGCGERRACRVYSMGQLMHQGADHCVTALANANPRATSVNGLTQITASCSRR